MLAGLILAVIIGVFSGLGAVLFRWLIVNFQAFFIDGGAQLLSFMGDYYIILIPAAGGLLVGPLVYYFARGGQGTWRAGGHGSGGVAGRADQTAGGPGEGTGFLHLYRSGGSVGREGPIVQIGSTPRLDDRQWLKLPEERCG
jgi:CIC family chloride channel protein